MSKIKQGKVTIENLDEVLAGLPEDQRAEAREQILEMFKDPEAVQAQAVKVVRLPPGTKDCPASGGDLGLVGASERKAVKLPDGSFTHFFECKVCDAPYEIPAGDA